MNAIVKEPMVLPGRGDLPQELYEVAEAGPIARRQGFAPPSSSTTSCTDGAARHRRLSAFQMQRQR